MGSRSGGGGRSGRVGRANSVVEQGQAAVRTAGGGFKPNLSRYSDDDILNAYTELNVRNFNPGSFINRSRAISNINVEIRRRGL